MNFHYSFDLKKDLKEKFPYIDKLSDKAQAKIERKIVDVIYESFLIPGDQDYLTARLLAQKGLHRSFFWSACQTIEKYLKALLLLNGRSVNKKKFRGHPIKKLYESAVQLLPDINLTPHEDLNIDSKNRKLLKSFTVEEFIEDIYNYGDPDNRYNASGVEFDTGHLFALDKLAYSLRGSMRVPDIEESFKNVEESLKSIFQDNNPLFCKINKSNYSKIPSPQFQIKKSGSVTMLEILIKNKSQNNDIALLWLKSKMIVRTNAT